MSKPLHPATVHFPLAFLTLAYGLDLYHAAAPSLPAAVTARAPATPELTRASYHLILFGLVAFVPAVVSGGQQAVTMVSKQGLYEADGKTIREKVKATIAHAVTMDLVLAGCAYLWSVRRAAVADSLAGELQAAAGLDAPYVAETWVVAAQAVVLGVMLFSASIGGKLTYNYGVGFQSLGAAKKKQ